MPVKPSAGKLLFQYGISKQATNQRDSTHYNLLLDNRSLYCTVTSKAHLRKLSDLHYREASCLILIYGGGYVRHESPMTYASAKSFTRPYKGDIVPGAIRSRNERRGCGSHPKT
jgi:hypothetical protein